MNCETRRVKGAGRRIRQESAALLQPEGLQARACNAIPDGKQG